MSSLLRTATRIPPAYFVFLALLATLWISKPQLMNLNVLGIFVRQVAPLGILVLGQLLVMRVRSIDLSGAGVLLLVNYLIRLAYLEACLSLSSCYFRLGSVVSSVFSTAISSPSVGSLL